ncbi:hypothetical protein [Paenibacillus tundrae]
MEDIDNIATHSETVTEPETTHPQADDQQQAMRDAYEAFNLPYGDDNDPDPDDDQQEEDALPIEPALEADEQPKGITVKYNGQDVFIPDEEVAVHARKGLNYEKVEGRAKQYETALDRLAKQQGYKDHADLLENIDQIESAAQQRQKDQFDELKLSMREEAMNAGIDPDVLDQYLDNHPLLQQAREVLQSKETEQTTRQQEQQQQQLVQGWQDLFKKYPELAQEVTDDGAAAPWLTQEMHARIERGYDPIDAYELVHRDKLSATERKRAEQTVLKNQRLNKRAQVETQASGTLEPQAPAELTGAFAMFGLDPKKANKYAKNFE